MYNEILFFIFASLILVIPGTSWLFLRRSASRTQSALIAKAFFFICLCVVISTLLQVSVFRFSFLVAAFIGPIIQIFLTSLIFWFFFHKDLTFRFYEQPFTTTEQLLDATKAIFDSKIFLSALRTALPTGKEDSKFGLDYIPYMLHSIDERRARVTNEARLFLACTIATALIFSTVIVYFGYILVNESSAGAARILSNIEVDAKTIAEGLPLLTPTYNNLRFQAEVVPTLYEIQFADPGAKNADVSKRVLEILSNARNSDRISDLSSNLNVAIVAASTDGKAEKAYVQLLSSGSNKVSLFLERQIVTASKVEIASSDLKPVLATADKVLSTPENRAAELIKRLGLGIVVSTFFLALLRYLGGLYKVRYQQVIDAERDDFMVRRFYVAFKNSFGSEQQRKVVLSGFMTGPSVGTLVAESSSADDSSKQAMDLMKELFAALSKKI